MFIFLIVCLEFSGDFLIKRNIYLKNCMVSSLQELSFYFSTPTYEGWVSFQPDLFNKTVMS
jgi:hypothetical protein